MSAAQWIPFDQSLEEGAPLRPWLYRIATNVCLDAIARDKRRVLATTSSQDDAGTDGLAAMGEVTWLQPYPDTRLEPLAPRDAEPDARLVTRANIELAWALYPAVPAGGDRSSNVLDRFRLEPPRSGRHHFWSMGARSRG